MINKKIQNSKLEPLINKINEIEDKYGPELCENLINRIELKISQLFDDFNIKSKQSFKLYWDNSSDLMDRFNQ